MLTPLSEAVNTVTSRVECAWNTKGVIWDPQTLRSQAFVVPLSALYREWRTFIPSYNSRSARGGHMRPLSLSRELPPHQDKDISVNMWSIGLPYKVTCIAELQWQMSSCTEGGPVTKIVPLVIQVKAGMPYLQMMHV